MSENSIPPALAESSQDFSDQIPLEDSLLDLPVEDFLDQGYSPMERNPHFEDRILDPEGLDRRLAEESPEVWDEGFRPATEADRAGRIIASDDGHKHQDVFATDAGVDGGGASAEEAAMHVIGENDAMFDDDLLEDEEASELLAGEYAD